MNKEINDEKNQKQEIKKNIIQPLKTRKKPKGYSRFLRNVIKDKTKVMKEIIKNRFIKWRKDALKGKIKKTVMIRISVSKPKDPKPKYQISKAHPKEQSKSVNKNDFKSVNINPNMYNRQNINNIRTQNIAQIEKEDNAFKKNENKNILVKNKDKEIEKEKIYKKINVSNTREMKPEKILEKNKAIPAPTINRNDKKQIIKKNVIPKININNDRINKSGNINKPIQIQNQDRYNSYNKIKTPSSNNNVVSVISSFSNKKYNTHENKFPKENNYVKKNNQNETKDKTPRINTNSRYIVNNTYTPIPIKTVKIDLNEKKYNNKTVNRQNNNQYLYDNLSYDKNKPQNKLLYNNYTYQRRNNNSDNRSIHNYSVKTEDNNNDHSSIYSRSRKDSSHTYGPTTLKNNLKNGKITVIQHYRGERKRYDNYDNNTYNANKYKNKLNFV